MNAENKFTTLEALIEILESVKGAMGGEAPLNRVLTYLYLAKGDLSGIPEDACHLIQKLQLSKATVHRHIQSLTDWHRYGEGKSYVEVNIDNNDRRRRVITLTPKGKVELDSIIKRSSPYIGSYKKARVV